MFFIVKFLFFLMNGFLFAEIFGFRDNIFIMKLSGVFRKFFFSKVFVAGVLAWALSSGGFAEDNVNVALQNEASQSKASGIYYSLFVRSFADSNGDGIGDFNGLTAKLDYLNDGDDSTDSDLGVTGIWLLPIYPSHSYHGYDVDDYYGVNPDYGTMEDFEHLVQECNKRGISVMLDMTVNHSGIYNQWFQKSRNPVNAEHEWYRWTTESENKFNLASSIWGHKIWNEDSTYKGNYYCGLFSSSMPDFNLDCPELRNEFKNVMKFWLEKGVSGFRYDAAGHVYNPIKILEKTQSVIKANEFFAELIAFNKSINPESYSVGEVWENSAVRADYAPGLGSNFHFDMGDNIIKAAVTSNDTNNNFAFSMRNDYERLQDKNENFIDAPFLSNHDQVRVMSRVHSVENAKLCAAAYLTLEGVPFIYYGEEIGMRSVGLDETKRSPFLWGNDDSMKCSWINDPYNAETESVAVQNENADSLLNFYKKLIRFRKSHAAFYDGKFKLESLKSRNISSWKMESEKEDAFVILNFTMTEEKIQLEKDYGDYLVSFVSSDSVKAKRARSGKYTIQLPGKQVIILTRQK